MRGKSRPVAAFPSVDALYAWVASICKPRRPRIVRPPRPPFQRQPPPAAPLWLQPGTDIHALRRAIAREALGGAPVVVPTETNSERIERLAKEEKAARVKAAELARRIEQDSRVRADRCTARCSDWAPAAVPAPCPVEVCSFPNRDVMYRANGYVKRFAVGSTIDQVITWLAKVCARPPARGWRQRPDGRPGAPAVPGARKRRSYALAPVAEPAAFRIPGQRDDETCAPVGIACKHALWACSGPLGSYYVAQGQRRPVSSFATVDAVIAWCNAL